MQQGAWARMCASTLAGLRKHRCSELLILLAVRTKHFKHALHKSQMRRQWCASGRTTNYQMLPFRLKQCD